MRAVIALLTLTFACTKSAEPERAPPRPTLTRWVESLETFRFERCEPGSKPVARLAIGTKLRLLKVNHRIGKRDFMELEDGGCVPRVDLSDTVPTAAAAMARAHDALNRANISAAAIQARRAEQLDPRARAPLLLQQAIFDATKEVAEAKRVYAALTKFPAPRRQMQAGIDDEPNMEVESGTAYVSATILNLRREPKRGAKIVRMLRINDRVEVTARDKGWARVTFQPLSSVEVRPIAQASSFDEDGDRTAANPDAPALDDPSREAQVAGWVAARFLQSARLDAVTQFVRADELEHTDRIEDAMTYLERAARLDRTDTVVLRRLIRLAIGAQNYRVAVWAATSLGQRQFGAEVRVDVAYGCRGAPTGAWVVEGEALPEEGCVTNVDIAEICEPDYERGPTEITHSDGDFEAARRAYEKSDQAKLDEKENAILEAEYERDVEVRRLRLAKLEAFEPHPYLRVTIVGPTDARSRMDRLFIYSFDTPRRTMCHDVDPASGSVLIYATPIDWPEPGETRTVFAELPMFGGAVHGVVAAGDVNDILEKIRERPEGEPRGEEWLWAQFPAGVYQIVPHGTCYQRCGC